MHEICIAFTTCFLNQVYQFLELHEYSFISFQGLNHGFFECICSTLKPQSLFTYKNDVKF